MIRRVVVQLMERYIALQIIHVEHAVQQCLLEKGCVRDVLIRQEIVARLVHLQLFVHVLDNARRL